jgi:hypothetical protein
MEISMTRNALGHVGAYIVIVGGLLVPAVGHAQSNYSPYDNQPSPAKNNCDTPTGCANYETGDRSRGSPARSSSRASRAQENRITAELNQQQLAGRNSQQTMTPAPTAR